jgi:hypothetical protein
LSQPWSSRIRPNSFVHAFQHGTTADTTSADDRDWPTPGETAGGSFWNPAGPFRPLRRIGWYLAGLLLVAGVLLLAINLLWAYLAFSALGTVLTGEVVLWFIDTVLAYLKQ